MANVPLQETFDIVVKHLRQQGRPAMKDGECMYLTDDGLKCAAGCLIPPEKYKKTFEHWSLRYRSSGILTDLGKIIENEGHNIELVCSLQRCHDGVHHDAWEAGFKTIAKKYGLAYTSPAHDYMKE